MTPDDIRTFVTNHAAKFASHDCAGLAADYTENATIDTMTGGAHQGRAAIEAFYERWITAFPHMGYTVESVVAEEDRAAVFFAVSGTHEGDFLGLPATGKRIEFSGVMLRRFEDGLIAHERFVYDFSGLLIKLGAVKVKPGA